jgi:hypothetical protein
VIKRVSSVVVDGLQLPCTSQVVSAPSQIDLGPTNAVEHLIRVSR